MNLCGKSSLLRAEFTQDAYLAKTLRDLCALRDKTKSVLPVLSYVEGICVTCPELVEGISV